MAVIGIGMDIVLVSRIERMLDRYGERFLKRIYHPTEIEKSQTRRKNAEYLAGCFAVKEAALKALSDFPGRGIAWNCIYISNEPSGKPVLHFEGNALLLAEEKGVRNSHVTITHDGDLALAQVLLEE